MPGGTAGGQHAESEVGAGAAGPDVAAGKAAAATPPGPAQGVRPFADDKACFAGIVYQLRNGIRWNDLPPQFPAGVTCWRRHRDWAAAGAWDGVWKMVLAELAEAARGRGRR